MSPEPLKASLLSAEILKRLAAKQPDFADPQLPLWLRLDDSVAHRTHVRVATAADIPSLLQLDTICWTAALRSTQERLEERLARHPGGQLIALIDDKVVGAIYSQRIDDVNALKGLSSAQFPVLHRSNGVAVQLLGVCVHPDRPGLGIGELLVQLMLLLAAADTTVKQVVAVTMCRDFASSGSADISTYILERDNFGLPPDPILRFHVARGAQILAAVEGAYPGYTAGGEAGVLIQYSTNLVQTTSDGPLPIAPETAMLAIEDAIQEVLKPSRLADYSPDRSLSSMGLDSLDLHSLRVAIERRLDCKINPTFFFRYPTAKRICDQLTLLSVRTPCLSPQIEASLENQALSGEFFGKPSSSLLQGAQDSQRSQMPQVAIIGMACRFPGGINSPEALWEFLQDGGDGITDIPSSRWDVSAFYDHKGGPGKTVSRRGGFLTDVEQFDPGFFGMSPREAAAADPQQRLLLEVSWEALERSGIDPHSLAHSVTGVVMGVSGHDYERLVGDSSTPDRLDGHYGTGNAASISSGRIAYVLGLEGPSLTVDTACSSGLVAVHLAARSVALGECRLALAGAVNLILTPELSIAFSQAGMLSPDGRCKVFSDKADGYVRSEGCAVVVLKCLEHALADGDQILAVIEGSALNNDGRSNGLTAPNGLAQAEVIRQALSTADVDPSAIGYVEAHGTGTALGDPIEVAAILDAYCQGRNPSNRLIIGSVKANIGHAETAAGLAGLIKSVMVLQHGCIPRQLHLDAINPLIDLAQTSANFPLESTDWPPVSGTVRRIGISSFGFAGTNAHLILAESPPQIPQSVGSDRDHHLLVLSGHSPSLLRETVTVFLDHLKRNTRLAPADVAYTSAVGRSHRRHRLAVLGQSLADWTDDLERCLDGQAFAAATTGDVSAKPPTVAFLFTGQGSQFHGMAAELCKGHPVARATIEECAELFSPYLDHPLNDILDGDPDLLLSTENAQPALFAVELALARTWIDCGIRPAAVLGHSLGEIVAACVAGVLDLPDAVQLVALRGRLMQQTAPGAMAVIFAGSVLVRSRLTGPVSIAAFNAPENTVISGPTDAVERLLVEFESDGIKTRRLNIACASHSSLMETVLKPLAAICKGLKLNPPMIPMVSSLTGTCIGEENLDQDYWVRLVREPVNFLHGIRSLADLDMDVFLEIGPRPVLISLAQECLHDRETACFLPSLLPGESNWQTMSRAAGELFVKGAPIVLSQLDTDVPRQKVTLPTSPFVRQRCWVPPRTKKSLPARQLHGHQLDLAIDAIVFSSMIGADHRPELEGHRIHGQAVLPAAAAVQMMSDVYRETNGAQALVLSDVIFQSPLLLSKSPTIEVQVIHTSTDDVDHMRLAARSLNVKDWTTHVVATVSPFQSTDLHNHESLTVIRTRLTEKKASSEFYTTLAARGCKLDPLFRGLSQFWVGQNEVLGYIHKPDEGEALDWLASTLRLDNAFLLVQAVLPKGRELPIPVSFDRIVLPGELPSDFWCHVMLRSEHPAECSYLADLTLFDEAGLLIGEVHGGLFRAAARPDRDPATLLYGWEWSELPELASAKLASAELASALERRASELAVMAVQDLSSAETRSFDQSDYRASLLARIQILPSCPAVPCESSLLDQFPEAALEIDLLERCGAALSDVLRGKQVGLDVLAPGADLSVLEKLYGASASFAPAQAALVEAVASIAARHDTTRPLRILEIGAGTGATTLKVLPVLAQVPVDYVFSDVSPTFLQEAQRKLSEWTLDYRLLDIENDPKHQGFSADFDIVIAANVLHATADLDSTIGYVVRLLAPDGVLLLLEGVAQRLWIDLIFGLLPGWWSFNDRWRSDHPLLEGSQWQSLLAQNGLIVDPFDPLGGMDAPFPQAVILARKQPLQIANRSPFSRQWFVFGEASGLGSDLAKIFIGHGESCQILADSEDVVRALEQGCTDIVDLQSLTLSSCGDPVSTLVANGPVFLHFAQLLARHVQQPIRYHRITRGSLAISPKENARPDVAALNGIAQVLGREHPQIEFRQLDIDSDKPDINALTKTLLASATAPESGEQTVALRGRRRFVPRLRHQAMPRSSSPTFPGTQLITGGLGDVGRIVTEWLVDHGAQSIAVVGRVAPSQEQQRWLDTIGTGGVRIRFLPADISSRTELEETFALMARDMPPLRGVFHCAGSHDDQLVESQDWPRLNAVLSGKLYGAWNLHELTASHPLDYFVLFSSAMALYGGQGLASYVAANAGLDALALSRRAQGLPALSVGWGPWLNTGMARFAKTNPIGEWKRQGLDALPPEIYLSALDLLIGEASYRVGSLSPLDSAQVAVMSVDWGEFRQTFPVGPPASLASLGVTVQDNKPVAMPPAAPEAMRKRLEPLPKRRQLQILSDHLVELLAAVLGIPSGAEIDRSQGFFAMGMDSLTTLDLRNRIQGTLGCRVEQTAFFRHSTIDSMTQFLWQKLFSTPVSDLQL